jgi:hypothetical protein
MAQKLYAIVNRERGRGRDFYDLVFLMGRNIKPNYSYLNEKLSISNSNILKESVLGQCSQLDMKAMAGDVKPFLFDADDAKKVRLFKEVVAQYDF